MASPSSGIKLSKMRVAEIREQLQRRGIDSSGTRNIILKRLREAINQEQKNAKEQNEKNLQNARSQQQQMIDQAKKAAEDRQMREEKIRREREIEEKWLAQEALRQQQQQLAEGKHMEQKEPSDNEEKPSIEEEDLQEQVPQQRRIQFVQTWNAPDDNGDGQNTTDDIQDQNDDTQKHDLGSMHTMSMEDRIRIRQQRFGVEKGASIAQRDAAAAARRRQRFGLKQDLSPKKSIEKNSRKRLHDRVPLGKTAQDSADEDVRRKRAEKFGLNSGTKESNEKTVNVSPEETERRQRRQQRFSNGDRALKAK